MKSILLHFDDNEFNDLLIRKGNKPWNQFFKDSVYDRTIQQTLKRLK